MDDPTDYLEHVLSVTGVSQFPWGAFAQRAIEEMTPTMESGFSLGNFLYELKEMKGLVRWWNKGRDYFFGWKNMPKGFMKTSLSEVTLSYNYGLRLFILDLIQLAQGLLSVQDRLAKLKAGAGKLQVRRYTEEVGIQELDSGYQWADGEIRQKLWCPGIKYTAVMTYTYQFPEIDESMEQLYALLDTVGLNLNPQVVWDAIPYTFVVDWFFNVGDFLGQLRKKWIPIQIAIKDFGVSCKLAFHSDSEIRGTGKIDSDWVPRSEVIGKYYLRKPLAIEDRLFTISQPTEGNTLRQFVLGSLLLKQRVL
jgi:hypothetical protein